ncbi:uncharacterized protein C2845_PM03G04140 [Panicum miliaceum]|uniref:DUF8204 domain-containing protein n=1 Tax=Panicum miliaceum TaxID=4540 RepID=A0A3L6TF38_PANMI|nr:uncharacterized protein C2845_PM03G04140 [Panicum miliaceum]
MGEASPESGGAAAGGAAAPAPPRKGKSCKGCLYYSSVLKSRGYNPICVGIPRSISQVPNYVVDEPKEEAMSQGHDLRQFRYGCAGYSMYVDNKDSQGGESEGKTLLPYCRGLEKQEMSLQLLADSRLVEKKPSTAEQAPAHVSNDGWCRFKRSAGLVASGVAKNLNKTANYIKENIQDIVYPDRRPPK